MPNYKAKLSEALAKIQYLVDFMDRQELLEEHRFTFPDGDMWESTKED